MLAAIYLEAGFETARRIVRALWTSEVHELPESAVDPKSALQEWAQGRGLKLPRYVAVGRTGPDHAPRFLCEVRIDGLDPARGGGASKRDAEMAAATAFLSRSADPDATAIAPDALPAPRSTKRASNHKAAP